MKKKQLVSSFLNTTTQSSKLVQIQMKNRKKNQEWRRRRHILQINNLRKSALFSRYRKQRQIELQQMQLQKLQLDVIQMVNT